jgi:hypothetical protein
VKRSGESRTARSEWTAGLSLLDNRSPEVYS